MILKLGENLCDAYSEEKLIKIGYLNFLKKIYDNEVIMEETWSRVEADLSLLKMTTTCPGTILNSDIFVYFVLCLKKTR